MPNITIPSDFLASNLRTGVLYELVVSLGVEITEIRFRDIISELNVQFITPRVIFSSLWNPKQLTVYYSTDGQLPAISQKEVVFALMSAFDNYGPSILYEESGEIPGAVPLLTPKKDPIPLFSPEYIADFFNDAKEKVTEVAKDIVDEIEKVTGWPRWAFPYILGAGAISVFLLVLYVKIKPVLVIKTKGS